METLQNDFTTPEQSKRLLELGLPQDSANMILDGYIDSANRWVPDQYPRYLEHPYSVEIKNESELYMNNVLPCWSAGRLIEMWEICVVVKFDRWSRNGVLLPLIEDCIEHIEFALNPYTKVEFDFSKLED